MSDLEKLIEDVFLEGVDIAWEYERHPSSEDKAEHIEQVVGHWLPKFQAALASQPVQEQGEGRDEEWLAGYQLGLSHGRRERESGPGEPS